MGLHLKFVFKIWPFIQIYFLGSFYINSLPERVETCGYCFSGYGRHVYCLTLKLSTAYSTKPV